MSDTQDPNENHEPDSNDPVPEAVVRVDIDAAPDQVWQALTTDDGLAGWLGDGSTIGADAGDEIDIHDVVTGQRKRGVLDEVTPGHRLGYTWWPETQPSEATRVAISIEPLHAGTRVTVVESRPHLNTHRVTTQRARTPQASACTTADWSWRAALLSIRMGQPVPVWATSAKGFHGR